jgi:wobble nucleotide-excising tRNase
MTLVVGKYGSDEGFKVINRLQLFRNVGQFDSVASAADLPLRHTNLIYAENGRGKTTLAAIMRSLATGDPLPIAERRRLAAEHPPHIVLDCTGGPPPALFQNNAWNRSLPNIVVFDDVFIDENVYSGLSVDPEHRQHLHDLILGTEGVTLNRRLQELAARIDEHNRALRVNGDAIPAAIRGSLSVDDFCSLQSRDDIDAAIQVAERTLSAAQEQDTIRTAGLFEPVMLPAFDTESVAALLACDLPALDAAAVEQVNAHIRRLGEGGEAWVADGMSYIPSPERAGGSPQCPFCAQDLGGSPLISHYRAYFSEGYSGLKQAVTDTLANIHHLHGGEAMAAFERAIRVWGERRQFWSRFCDVPGAALDTAEIARAWRAAREAVINTLQIKQASPLEPTTLSDQAFAAINAYDSYRRQIADLSAVLQRTNTEIRLVKEQAAVGNRQALLADVVRLKAIRNRYRPDIALQCATYLDEKAAKAVTEEQRNQARAALDRHRQRVFPAYQDTINIYLQRFNAGFRLAGVTSTNTRTGSSCTYNVLINNQSVPVGANRQPGTPSFRNVLSAGDRNTLALAFFFASLDQDPALAEKIVVIDDPITSLDEHRSLTTVQEIRRLAERTAQIFVLSHNKPLLCRIWEGINSDQRVALEVIRDGVGSTIRSWDVNQDCITENDRRHALLRDYLATNTPDRRQVAVAIRPVIEAFFRVACPEHFPPGTLLGPFRNLCEQRAGTSKEILSRDDIRQFRDLVEYANRFHHDTNPAWEAEIITDGELTYFVQATLNFAKK